MMSSFNFCVYWFTATSFLQELRIANIKKVYRQVFIFVKLEKIVIDWFKIKIERNWYIINNQWNKHIIII